MSELNGGPSKGLRLYQAPPTDHPENDDDDNDGMAWTPPQGAGDVLFNGFIWGVQTANVVDAGLHPVQKLLPAPQEIYEVAAFVVAVILVGGAYMKIKKDRHPTDGQGCVCRWTFKPRVWAIPHASCVKLVLEIKGLLMLNLL